MKAVVTVTAQTHPDDWRSQARSLLRACTHPDDLQWLDPDDPQATLFGAPPTPRDVSAPASASTAGAAVPRAFLDLSRQVLAHTDPTRFATLYRVLYRLTLNGERGLLRDAADPDVHALLQWAKAVRRDAHKMKAFVRFRRVTAEESGGGELFIAFHRPDYNILAIVGPFFARRFGVMRWTILTPRGSLDWNGSELTHGPPAVSRDAPSGDALEDLWRTYYASVFNPARLNERAMVREMPKRHWATLPEASLIDQLLREAASRTDRMVAAAPTSGRSAAEHLPAEHCASLPVLRNAAAACRGCDIYKCATQVVFGVGPEDARLMLIGQQPGNDEDLAGVPFIGPAGELLNRALSEAGVSRSTLYITNAVKHFKWTPSAYDNRRQHSRASIREVSACRPWLEQEIGLVRPACILLLGATAAQSLLGPAFRITASRGQRLTGTRWAPSLIATWHPAALLRAPNPAAAASQYAELVNDLKIAAGVAGP